MGLFSNTANVVAQAAEPTPVAGMIWIETDANENWRRNDANNAWVSFVNTNTTSGFSTITKDILTGDDTTTSGTFEDTLLSVTLPNDNKKYIAVATCAVKHDTNGSTMFFEWDGSDDDAPLNLSQHDTLGRKGNFATVTSGTQTGGTLKLMWHVDTGEMTMFTGSNMVVFGVA